MVWIQFTVAVLTLITCFTYISVTSFISTIKKMVYIFNKRGLTQNALVLMKSSSQLSVKTREPIKDLFHSCNINNQKTLSHDCDFRTVCYLGLNSNIWKRLIVYCETLEQSTKHYHRLCSVYSKCFGGCGGFGFSGYSVLQQPSVLYTLLNIDKVPDHVLLLSMPMHWI